MPAQFSSLLIMILSILPGFLGERIYRYFSGSDWRLSDWEKIIRILIFSILGILVYCTLAYFCKWPQPIYIIPSSLSAIDFGSSFFTRLILPYIGHWLASTIIGLISGYVSSLISKKRPSLVYQSCWDIFIHERVNAHLVVVTLRNGDAYAGILSCADSSVSCDERDIIIEEPAKLNKFVNNYVALGYSYLFLPSTLISSIAVVFDPDLDERLTQVGEKIFSK